MNYHSDLDRSPPLSPTKERTLICHCPVFTLTRDMKKFCSMGAMLVATTVTGVGPASAGPEPLLLAQNAPVASGSVAATNGGGSRPPAKIDVSRLPAKIVDEVVVPVPSEIFAVLDKLGSPNWHDVLRTSKNRPPQGDRSKIALLLGTVIAEGFIAVEARDSEEVKKIGRSVLSLAEAINVRKSVIARSKSIIDSADKQDWNKVRKELDGALQDVKHAMVELHDEQLAQLVSLGGWLRGTEALTYVVNKGYTKDSAELLHQPTLLDYFQKRLDGMDARLKSNEIVGVIQKRLKEIRPLIEPVDGAISAGAVEQIHGITQELVKAVTSKDL